MVFINLRLTSALGKYIGAVRGPSHLLRLLLELLFFDFFVDFFFSSSESELLLLLDESDSEPLSSLSLSSFLILFLDLPPPTPPDCDFLERLAAADGVTDLSLLWGATGLATKSILFCQQHEDGCKNSKL